VTYIAATLAKHCQHAVQTFKLFDPPFGFLFDAAALGRHSLKTTELLHYYDLVFKSCITPKKEIFFIRLIYINQKKKMFGHLGEKKKKKRKHLVVIVHYLRMFDKYDNCK